MFVKLLLVAACLVGTVVQAAEGNVLQIDVSGMEQIFQIQNLLARDEEPSDALWDALLGGPGYATLLRHEKNRGPVYYKDCFRLTCKPSLEKQFESILKSPKTPREEALAKALPHYRKARDARKTLESWVHQLKADPLGAGVLSLASAYLPEGAPRSPVSVAFIIFAPDARGYDPILMDLLYYAQFGPGRDALLAHELHHAWRRQWENTCLGDEDSAIWALKQVMQEGVADRINIGPALETAEGKAAFAADENGRDYLKHLERCPDIVRAMDALLLRMARDPSQREAAGVALQKLVPRSGHLPGFYMASLIEAKLGRAVLIKNQINPASFFQAYNLAAAKDGLAPRFSEEAMSYVRHLGRSFETFK